MSRGFIPAPTATSTGVPFKLILKSQKPALAGVVLSVIPLGLLVWGHFLMHPATQTVFGYDASIRYPLRTETVSPILAILPGFCALLLSLVILETVCNRRLNGSGTMAASLFLHFALDSVQMLIVTLAVTEVTKSAMGELRPDFLSRCNYEAEGALPVAGLTWDSGDQVDCLPAAGVDLKDGRMSFPSGHASASGCLAMYATFYILWAVFVRARAAQPVTFPQQLWRCVALYWVLLQLAWAWFVGLSRIRDHRHHVGDVLGGFAVGCVVAAVFCWRAICQAPLVVSTVKAGLEGREAGADAHEMRILTAVEQV